jgi:hypothetical protein
LGFHGSNYLSVGGNVGKLVFGGDLIFGAVHIIVAGQLQKHEDFYDFSGCRIRIQSDYLFSFKEAVDKLHLSMMLTLKKPLPFRPTTKLHPVLPRFPLQNDTFLVVSPASRLWAKLRSFFSLNSRGLRPNFPSFRQRTVSRHEYTPNAADKIYM